MKAKLKVVFLSVMAIFVYSISGSEQTTAFSNQVIERGAFGDDVIELQARLQYIGFYTGEIDGKFGYGTYWALRNFQDQYGLPIDGIAGTDTKQKLVSVSKFNRDFVHQNIESGHKFTHYGGTPIKHQVKKTSSGGGGGATNTATTGTGQLPGGYTEKDLQLMANAVYGEARGEPYEGQVAVAAVILNRVEHSDFPNSVSEVIFQPLAFTAVADGQIWLTPNERAKQAVIDALNGWDPTENAIYYFNPDTATSEWIWTRPQIKKIGQHIFCM